MTEKMTFTNRVQPFNKDILKIKLQAQKEYILVSDVIICLHMFSSAAMPKSIAHLKKMGETLQMTLTHFQIYSTLALHHFIVSVSIVFKNVL